MTPQQPQPNKNNGPSSRHVPPVVRGLLGQRIGRHREDVQRTQQDHADVGVKKPWDEGTIQPDGAVNGQMRNHKLNLTKNMQKKHDLQ